MLQELDGRLARLMEARREIERLRLEEQNCPARETLSKAAIEALAETLKARFDTSANP